MLHSIITMHRTAILLKTATFLGIVPILPQIIYMDRRIAMLCQNIINKIRLTAGGKFIIFNPSVGELVFA